VTSDRSAKPRLRFDKVATRVVERLQAALATSVPDGLAVAVTITAPIRLAAKTTAAVEEKVRALVGRGSLGRGWTGEIHGNRVRIGLLRSESERAPKLIGLVHNPDSDPLLLWEMAREQLGASAAPRAGRRSLRADTRRGRP